MDQNQCRQLREKLKLPLIDEKFLLKMVILQSRIKNERENKLADSIVYTNNPEKAFANIIFSIEDNAEGYNLDVLENLLKIIVTPNQEVSIINLRLINGQYCKYPSEIKKANKPNDKSSEVIDSIESNSSPRSIFILNYDYLTHHNQRRLMSDSVNGYTHYPIKEWNFCRNVHDNMCFLVDLSDDSDKHLSSDVTSRCKQFLFCV